MASDFPDHYAVLHVPRTATQREIARAYRALMRTHHPDLDNPTAVPAELQHVMQAFDVLRDPGRRLAYDREFLRKERRAGAAGSGGGPSQQDRRRTGQAAGDTSAGIRHGPVGSEAPSQEIPVRHVRHTDPPLRVTPVRWESGPWVTVRFDPRGERRR
jgi:DnaJ-class molecular chaperone